MIRTIRRAFHNIVECDCGFRQTASSDALADGIVRSHNCKPAVSRRTPTSRNSTSNRA